MESMKEKLKKELEEELKLNSEELRSHAWYHGPLPRKEAEALLQTDGHFLIRDSRSSPGDYVLTCKFGQEALHFKIIRVVLRPKKGYSRTLFQFEQEQFDNIPALVRFYVGNRKIISEGSEAVIVHPVTRNVPLRLLEERYREPGQQPKELMRRQSFRAATPAEALESNLLRSRERSGSHPASLDTVGKQLPLHSAQSDSNLLTANLETLTAEEPAAPPHSPIFRTGSDPLLRSNTSQQNTFGSEGGSPLRGSDGQLHSKAPPKPLRVPSLLLTENTYCELVPKVPTSVRSYVDRLRAEEKWKSRARVTETTFGFLDTEMPCTTLTPCCEEASEEREKGHEFVRPQIETGSCFKPKNFLSLLLSPENKPLDPGALKVLKEVFTQSECRTTALHILHIDCQVIRICGVSLEQQRMMGVGSGLELITLPHGHQLRKDLLERHHLIALGIVVDILGCSGTVAERAATLHKIIQLAVELKASAGDLFAFSAVMQALEFPQIVRLDQTWTALRQHHTESAITFQKQLKPFMKALNEGNTSVPMESFVVPHILPLIRVMEGTELWDHTEESCDLLLSVLESARSIAGNARVYQRNAEAKLSGFEPSPQLLEAFRTEFALRLFWGSKGAEAAQNERYKKFNQVLTVLSQKLEPEKTVARRPSQAVLERPHNS
ncbi:breast cancer anti-estrogen resistance protein 3-like [Rhinatrema bivittatum]|uniref:breast cancer anti-estrogen resistance protein 3-like n=1 Tax=Rhinatrema bivittatum TaxID=194408 RepID=UPI001127C62B|nr:breast cancer anti-estrogen resistance protein 3-like [Rhinatrema bivittatum]XP_029440911.1 breast cancer anti-estrogen resistance protein 3-like [Rhinatrema bivittatum]XP_029440912.1 breast cancer anti-estrogen resistance protein 3-like [Rhinatrema bivittatum]XP_029440913.1 breast cancer anti-estrogen resistance protein 3-like [Rhinatrema bivittatum]